MTLERNVGTATAAINFDRLNPTMGKRVKINKDALALIVGVADYKNTPAKAVFADSDAMMFRDYASEKLGIPESRIKTLVNDGADERELLLSVKSWLARASKQGRSDVYVFFAGHGLASNDGKELYILPQDSDPDLLKRTALSRSEIFDTITKLKPKSVTMFFDTCFSGINREGEQLVDARFVSIAESRVNIPNNFSVISSSGNLEWSRNHPEQNHGLFTYHFLKGLEKKADTNNDKQITLNELFGYTQKNVQKDSNFQQNPEISSNSNYILVDWK